MKRRIFKKKALLLILAVTSATLCVMSGSQSQASTPYNIDLVYKIGMEPLYLAEKIEPVSPIASPKSTSGNHGNSSPNTHKDQIVGAILTAIVTLIITFIGYVADYTNSWFGQCLARWLKTNKIKFIDAEITLFTKDKFIEQEEKLNLGSQVLVNAIKPLESTELTVAKRIYNNVRKKQIFYDYIFPFGELTECKKIDDSRNAEEYLRGMVRVVRNILISYLIFESDFLKKYSKAINPWYEKHNTNYNYNLSYQDKVLQIIDRMNDEKIKDFLEANDEDFKYSYFTKDKKKEDKDPSISQYFLNKDEDIWGHIEHYVTIHIVPTDLYETVCIYKIQKDVEKPDCYVRLNPNVFLKMLPEEASRKLKSYEKYRKIHGEKTIFEIHPYKEHDGRFTTAIKTILKAQWKELMPNYMEDYLDVRKLHLININPKTN